MVRQKMVCYVKNNNNNNNKWKTNNYVFFFTGLDEKYCSVTPINDDNGANDNEDDDLKNFNNLSDKIKFYIQTTKMTTCIENISQFINQWGYKLQPLPEYQVYFELSFIGNSLLK